MGRTSKDAKQMLELSNQFEPLELNEAEVRALFNRCGKRNADGNIDWDVYALVKDRANIRYLLGQLAPVHQGLEEHELDRAFFKKYDGSAWADDWNLLIDFQDMGEKITFFSSSKKEDGKWLVELNLGKAKFTLLEKLTPTLSPKDPKFAAWWEGADGLMVQIQAAKDELKPDEDLFSLYEKAAQQGSRDAQYKTGICYVVGKGTQKDNEAALKWFQAAAKQGHEKAAYLSGLMCKKGLFGTKAVDLVPELSKRIDRLDALSDSEHTLVVSLMGDGIYSDAMESRVSEAVMGSLDKALSRHGLH